MVIEDTPKGERSFDIFSRLLRDRIIMLSGEIEPAMANVVIAQMLLLESENPNADINLYIQSPGGDVAAGYAILDTMQYIKPNIRTIGMGLVASMAAVLLAGGEKGKRTALPNSTIMIHQPLGGFSGQASDVAIHAERMRKTKEDLIKKMAAWTGKSAKAVEAAMERDNFLSAAEALDFGLIDQITEPKAGKQ
jgi:ATP-dependent Clp protease protease subunit